MWQEREGLSLMSHSREDSKEGLISYDEEGHVFQCMGRGSKCRWLCGLDCLCENKWVQPSSRLIKQRSLLPVSPPKKTAFLLPREKKDLIQLISHVLICIWIHFLLFRSKILVFLLSQKVGRLGDCEEAGRHAFHHTLEKC